MPQDTLSLLNKEQQERYNQLVAAGADKNTALNAVRQIPTENPPPPIEKTNDLTVFPSSVFTSPRTIYDIQELLKENKRLSEELSKLSQPTEKEIALEQEYNQMKAAGELAEEQARTAGETLSFAAGETERVSRLRALKEIAKAREIEAEERKRAGMLETIKTKLGLNKDEISRIIEIEKEIENKKEKLQDNYRQQINQIISANAWESLTPEQKYALWTGAGYTGIPPERLSKSVSAPQVTEFNGNKYQWDEKTETWKLLGRAEEESDKPLSILDIGRWNELYPNAGIIAGDTQKTATEKVLNTLKPRDFTDDEIRTMIRNDLKNGRAYEDILSAIQLYPTLKNKERAIQILDEETKTKQNKPGLIQRLFGGGGEKKKETTTGTTGTINKMFEGYNLEKQINEFNKMFFGAK